MQPTPIVTDVIQRKAKAHREYNGEHQGFVVFHCVSFHWLIVWCRKPALDRKANSVEASPSVVLYNVLSNQT
jgi:hypothetical protein